MNGVESWMMKFMHRELLMNLCISTFIRQAGQKYFLPLFSL